MKTIVVALLALAASGASAQGVRRPDPADASVRAPKPVYRSAFAGYRPYGEEDPSRWREANDEAGRLGGHAGHAKPAGKSSEEKKQ